MPPLLYHSTEKDSLPDIDENDCGNHYPQQSIRRGATVSTLLTGSIDSKSILLMIVL